MRFARLLTSYTFSEMISLLGHGYIDAWIQRFRDWVRPEGRRAPAEGAPASMEWVVVDSAVPAALAAMYQDVLRQHGIPALVQTMGGAMGGVPMDVRLLVPAQHVAEAHELLRGNGGVESERMVDGGER